MWGLEGLKLFPLSVSESCLIMHVSRIDGLPCDYRQTVSNEACQMVHTFCILYVVCNYYIVGGLEIVWIV